MKPLPLLSIAEVINCSSAEASKGWRSFHCFNLSNRWSTRLSEEAKMKARPIAASAPWILLNFGVKSFSIHCSISSTACCWSLDTSFGFLERRSAKRESICSYCLSDICGHVSQAMPWRWTPMPVAHNAAPLPAVYLLRSQRYVCNHMQIRHSECCVIVSVLTCEALGDLVRLAFPDLLLGSNSTSLWRFFW